MALISLPELEPSQYMWIGFAFALIGFVFTLTAIAIILGFVDLGISYIIVTALGIGALLVATLAFHKLGRKRIAV